MTLYEITDYLSLIPVAVAAGFALLGLCQSIRRERLLRVDADILILRVFYIAVIAVYIFFELFVVNRRPVLIGGYSEPSPLLNDDARSHGNSDICFSSAKGSKVPFWKK